jgi:hypothetical protein
MALEEAGTLRDLSVPLSEARHMTADAGASRITDMSGENWAC